MADLRACATAVELLPDLHLLCDAAVEFPDPVHRAFPGSPPAAAPWVLHSHCFVLRTAGRLVLIDAGVGPADGPAGQWLGAAGRLPELLASIDVAPADVDTVVLTHLHLDHVGWTVAQPAGEPFFPEAEYVVQRRDLEHSASRGGAVHDRLVAPLVRAGRLVPVDGEREVTARVRLLPTPGHTPGHQSVLVESGPEPVLLAGDAFVHPLQVDDPALAYAAEWDAQVATATRRALLAAADDRPLLLAPAHFGEPAPLPRQPADPVAGLPEPLPG